MKEPDPINFVNGCLLVLTGSFLVLVGWVVCQDAARTRAQMESAIKGARQERLLTPGPATPATAGAIKPPTATKCVTGQVHGPESMPAPGDLPIN